MEAWRAEAIVRQRALNQRERGSTGFCYRHKRKTIIKRWTDHEGFHSVLKCRRCDWYERIDIPLKVAADVTEIPLRKRTIVDPTGKSNGDNGSSPPDNQHSGLSGI